jgi:arginase
MRDNIKTKTRNAIHFVEIPSELGAGTRGASLGVQALKTAALNAKSTLFGQYPYVVVPTENRRLHQILGSPYPFAKHIDGVLRVYEHIVYTLSPLLRQRECFPVVLAGDHSTSAATLAALRIANPKARLGAVWIDAHADLHTPFTTPSGNLHGMPLGVSLAIDNLDKQRNEPCAETQLLWKKLQHLGNISPKIYAEDLAFVALRSTEPEEEYLLEQHNVPIYLVEQVRKEGAKAVAERVLDQLSSCDMIYISFDVDSMDCNLVSRGTGTPVENGLTPDEAQIIIQTLLDDPRTCCLEITEVNPTLDDKCNKMADTTFRILQNLVPSIARRGRKITEL